MAGQVLRYPVAALLGDYGRGAAGLLLGLALLLLPLAVVLKAIGALFALLGSVMVGITAWRHRHPLLLAPDGVSQGHRRVSWAALERLSLAHYALRRDHAGWLELTLATPGGKVTADSRLEGFAELLAAAVAAARMRELPLAPATRVNLASLGHVVD